MKSIYIINGTLLFDSLIGKLQPYPQKEDDKNHYQLNTPASRCLQLLIDKHGEVVSQEEFFDYVWLQHGHIVSANSFYQNISLLRKAIKKAGMNDDLIITVPKKGIILPERFSVDPLENNQPAPEHPLSAAKKYFNHKKKVVLLSLSVLISLSLITLAVNQNIKPDYASEYVEKDINQDGCTFFINKDERYYDNHLSFLKDKRFDCSMNKFVYLKTYDNIKKVSIFQCIKKMESDTVNNFCVSEYYPLGT